MDIELYKNNGVYRKRQINKPDSNSFPTSDEISMWEKIKELEGKLKRQVGMTDKMKEVIKDHEEKIEDLVAELVVRANEEVG